MDHSETTASSRYQVYPLIPLRGISVFPGMRLIFDVEREDNIAAVDAAMESDQMLFLTGQRDPSADSVAGEDDLFRMGTVCHIQQVLRVPDEEGAKVMAEGVARAYLASIMGTKPYMAAQVETVAAEANPRMAVKAEALIRQCYGLLEKYAETAQVDLSDVLRDIMGSSDAGRAAARGPGDIGGQQRESEARAGLGAHVWRYRHHRAPRLGLAREESVLKWIVHK